MSTYNNNNKIINDKSNKSKNSRYYYQRVNKRKNNYYNNYINQWDYNNNYPYYYTTSSSWNQSQDNSYYNSNNSVYDMFSNSSFYLPVTYLQYMEKENMIKQSDLETTSTTIDIPSVKKGEIIPKKFVTIPTPYSLKNLIDILQDNEVEEDVEYNIDIKSLKAIKKELIELNEMIGADTIKQSVFEQLIYFIQGLHNSETIDDNNQNGDYKHTVIIGPPGSGKTKIAKIIGNMYSKIGVLKNNTFKKVTRNDLIAGYLGQTAIKTKKLIEDNLGGVLFIDEAYSLSHENKEDMFSKECLDTLCEALSDYKNDLMVIIAGYEDELENRFFNLNSGLESRFIWRFKMSEYNAKDLMNIFIKIVENNGWQFHDKTQLNERWFKEKKDQFVGLGRDMEALFTYTKIAHGIRIYGKEKDMRKKISLDDMNKGFETFVSNNKNKKDETAKFMHTIYV